MVLDSVGPNGKRLVSIEARYWRALHSEVMTHRDRARNAASSRAIPFIRYAKCSWCLGSKVDNGAECHHCNGTGVGQLVKNCTHSHISGDPFLPEFIGAEQKGMQSGAELIEPNRSKALEAIDEMRKYSLVKCRELYELGVHKSIINRYLEPWSYITILMTATEWKNFFRLRVHPKAEKHFCKVATQIRDAIDASTPRSLQAGDWHLPYIDSVDHNADTGPFGIDLRNEEDVPKWVEHLKRVSAARCARLSYLTHDGARNMHDDLRIFETLIHPKVEEDRDDDVIHASALEHVAQASSRQDLRSGPFHGWHQFRKEFTNENVPG